MNNEHVSMQGLLSLQHDWLELFNSTWAWLIVSDCLFDRRSNTNFPEFNRLHVVLGVSIWLIKHEEVTELGVSILPKEAALVLQGGITPLIYWVNDRLNSKLVFVLSIIIQLSNDCIV